MTSTQRFLAAFALSTSIGAWLLAPVVFVAVGFVPHAHAENAFFDVLTLPGRAASLWLATIAAAVGFARSRRPIFIKVLAVDAACLLIALPELTVSAPYAFSSALGGLAALFDWSAILVGFAAGAIAAAGGATVAASSRAAQLLEALAAAPDGRATVDAGPAEDAIAALEAAGMVRRVEPHVIEITSLGRAHAAENRTSP